MADDDTSDEYVRSPTRIPGIVATGRKALGYRPMTLEEQYAAMGDTMDFVYRAPASQAVN